MTVVQLDVYTLTWPEFVLNLYSLKPGLLDTPGDLLGVNDGATIIHDTGFSATQIVETHLVRVRFEVENNTIQTDNEHGLDDNNSTLYFIILYAYTSVVRDRAKCKANGYSLSFVHGRLI